MLQQSGWLAHAGTPWQQEWPETDFSRRSVSFEEIVSGGPPKDGIPAIDRPKFVSVDEGSRGKRMLIGFGKGAESLEARVQVYQVTEAGLRRLVDAEAEAHGSKKPGHLVPVGAAAAAGRAGGAVIGGGVAVKSEISGPLESSARNLAREIAERAAAFYDERGWR